MAEERKQLNNQAAVRLWLVLTLAILIVVVVLVVGIRYLSSGALRDEIPRVPELGRAELTVKQQIIETDAFARQHPRSAEALGKLGMVYQSDGFLEEAGVAYHLAQRLAPRDYRWPYYLSLLEIANGRNEAALAFLEKTTDLNPDYPHAWARLGELYYRNNNKEKAEECFRKTLKLESDHPQAILGMARLAGDAGNWQQAADMLEAALKKNPHFGPAHDYLAICYGKLGKDKEKRRHEGLGADAGFQMPDPLVHDLYDLSASPSILITQAQIAKTSGDLTRAEKLFRRAVELAPDSMDTHFALAKFLMSPGVVNRTRMLDARQHLERAVELDPSYLNARHAFASVEDSLGHTLRAREEWQHIIDAEPDHAQALMSLGQIYYRRGDYRKAYDYYQRALAVPPDTAFSLGQPEIAYHHFAVLCISMNRVDEALAAFNKAEEENPRYTQAYMDHAHFLKDLRRNNDAIAVYRKGIEADSDNSELNLALGNFLIKLRMYEQARNPLANAVRLAPDDVRAVTALGYAELKSGAVTSAVTHLKQATEIDPDYYLAHFHLANAYLALGKTDLAAASFEVVLQLQPGFVPARQALQKLHKSPPDDKSQQDSAESSATGGG